MDTATAGSLAALLADPDAERNLVGAALIDEAARDVLLDLDPAVFSDAQARRIVRAIAEGATSPGEVSDYASVEDGTAAVLWAEAVRTTSLAPTWARTIRDLATRRAVVRQAGTLARAASEPGSDIDQALTDAAEALNRVQAGSDAKALDFVAMADLGNPESYADDELIRHRFLCRGGGALLIGQTGLGKSSLALQLAVAWTLGRATLGLEPARPLRCLVVQAENDAGDLAEVRDGLLLGLPKVGFPVEDVRDALAKVFVLTADHVAGEAFIPYLRRALNRPPAGPPDVVFLDPLLAYLGADASDQETVSRWLRNGINPILHGFGVGLILVHHTTKPRTDGNGLGANDLAYAGIGTSELANWARAVLALQSVQGVTGTFKITAGKRGSRLGWRDRDEEPTKTRYIAHATEPGTIYWRDATDGEALAAEVAASTGKGGRPRGPSNEALGDMMLNLVGGQPAPVSDLLARFQAAANVGEKKADGIRRDLEASGRIHRVVAKLPHGPQYLGIPGEVEAFVADLEGKETESAKTLFADPADPADPTGWKGPQPPLLSYREGGLPTLPAAPPPPAETVFADPGGFTDAY